MIETEMEAIASAFVAARRENRALRGYPGVPPASAAMAYAIQDREIALSERPVVGWKLAAVRPEWQERFGAARTVGPIFDLRQAGSDQVELRTIPSGFVAVEAEFAFLITEDVPPGTAAGRDLADLVASMHCAVELAGSPLAGLPTLGPEATVSDHANNLAVVIGPPIAGWREVAPEALQTSVAIGGEVVGTGDAGRVAGGPIGALGFLLDHLRKRGVTLRAGDWVATGATTGVHALKPPAAIEVGFGPFGRMRLEIA